MQGIALHDAPAIDMVVVRPGGSLALRADLPDIC